VRPINHQRNRAEFGSLDTLVESRHRRRMTIDTYDLGNLWKLLKVLFPQRWGGSIIDDDDL